MYSVQRGWLLPVGGAASRTFAPGRQKPSRRHWAYHPRIYYVCVNDLSMVAAHKRGGCGRTCYLLIANPMSYHYATHIRIRQDESFRQPYIDCTSWELIMLLNNNNNNNNNTRTIFIVLIIMTTGHCESYFGSLCIIIMLRSIILAYKIGMRIISLYQFSPIYTLNLNCCSLAKT